MKIDSFELPRFDSSIVLVEPSRILVVAAIFRLAKRTRRGGGGRRRRSERGLVQFVAAIVMTVHERNAQQLGRGVLAQRTVKSGRALAHKTERILGMRERHDTSAVVLALLG